MWRKVIASQHGEDEWGRVPRVVPRYRVSNLSGNIWSFGNEPINKGDAVKKRVGFKVGEGG